MRRFRVSSFLADVTQQIHSFRASGVIAAQRLFAAASDSMARRKSEGSLWIMTPNVRVERSGRGATEATQAHNISARLRRARIGLSRTAPTRS
jgi:hypothetical protein